MRKAYYSRVVADYEFTDEDIDNFVRSESSEHVLVDLAGIGVGQEPLIFKDNDGNPLVIARPDLLSINGKLIVEFKDAKTFERLTPNHSKFKGYMRQLLYYLVISECLEGGHIEQGVLCI